LYPDYSNVGIESIPEWHCNKIFEGGTEEFEELFKDYPLYSQEHIKDPLVIAKLFDPCGSATWFLTEYDPIEKIAFGYVVGLLVDEWVRWQIEVCQFMFSCH